MPTSSICTRPKTLMNIYLRIAPSLMITTLVNLFIFDLFGLLKAETDFNFVFKDMQSLQKQTNDSENDFEGDDEG